MTRARAATLLAIAVASAVPAGSRALDAGANPLSGITVREDAGETVITISAARTPTFTVFKLDDPVRLFIDVSQGDVARVADPVVVDNGVVDQVGTLQFRSHGGPVGRVIVGLRQDAPYDVRSSGNDIVVRVDGTARRPAAGDAAALAGKVRDVREQLRREQDLLAEVTASRAKAEALRSSEEAARREAERLRAEATSLKEKAQADAERTRVAASDEAKRLEGIQAATATAESQRKAAEQAVAKAAERLDLLKREAEVAAREHDATKARAEAERQKAAAIEDAARRAEAKRAAEEESARKAAEAARTAQLAAAAERTNLAAAREARTAEEAHRKAISDLAAREAEGLKQARTAREREENLAAEVAAAKARAEDALKRAQARKVESDTAVAADLEDMRRKADKLATALAAERGRATEAAREREAGRRAAADAVAAKERELATARQKAEELTGRVAALQTERDRAAAGAKAALAEATRVKSLAEQADEEVRRRETARAEATAAERDLAARRAELKRLAGDAAAQEAALKAVAERKARESEELTRVRGKSERAQARWQEVQQRLATEEARLKDLASRRARVEDELTAQRTELDDLKAGRKALETDEARALRERLEAREAEVASLRTRVAATESHGRQMSEAQAKAASELASKERELAGLREGYEDALARSQAEVSQARDEVARVREDAATEVASARRDASLKDATIRELTAVVQQTRQEVASARESIGSREAEVAELRRALATEKAGRADRSEVERLERTLAAKEATLKSVQADLADRLAAADAAVRKRAAEVERLSAELARMKEERSRAESAEVKSLRGQVESREAELTLLRKAYEDARKSLAGRQDDAGRLAKLKASLDGQKAAMEDVRREYEARLASERSGLAERDRQVAELTGRLSDLKSSDSARESAEVARLRAQVRAREAELVAVSDRYRTAEGAGNRSARELKDTKAKVAAAQKSLVATRADLDAARAKEKAVIDRESRAAARINDLSQALERTGRELAVARARAETAEREAGAAAREGREATARLSAQLKARQAEVDRLTAELTKARSASKDSPRARDLAASLVREKAGRDALARDLAQAQAATEEARREAATARQARDETASRMSAELKDRQAEVDRLAAELQTARSESGEESARSRSLAAELAEVRAREDVTRREMDDLKARVDAVTRKAETPKAKTIEAKAPAAGAAIRTMEFKEVQGVPTLVMAVEGQPDYHVTVAEKHYVMTLKGVTLPRELNRRMDVTAFESPVSMVSAYSMDDGSVRVVVDLSEPIGQSVRSQDGRLVWAFAGPSPSRMVAGAAPTPTVPRVPSKAAETAPASGGDGGADLAFDWRNRSRNRQRRDYDPTGRSDGPPSIGAGPGGADWLKPSLVPKKKKYKGKHINLTVKDADIQNVLTFLAREGRVNIVTSEDVRGKVTFHLEDVPWDLALDTVLKTKGLDYVVEQGIYRVQPIEAIQREYQAQVEKMKQQRELKPVVVRLVPLNYGEASEMLGRVSTVLSANGKADVDARTNTLILRDTEDYLTAAEDLLRRLDQQTPQILIEARIVEARTTMHQNFGIQWGGRYSMSPGFGNETGLVFPSSIGVMGGADPAQPAGGISLTQPHWAVNLPAPAGVGAGGALGITLGSVGGAANLSLRLSAAEEEGDVKIISSPRISTVNNKRATISQGVSIPISVVSAAGVNTQFFSADLQLSVQPRVTADGHIMMKMDISKNEPDFGNVAQNGNPTIQRREAHTELLVRDGDTSVIGGIYTRSTSRSDHKVPFLGSIPVLGWLFKNRADKDDRSELLIFITPKIVNREVAL